MNILDLIKGGLTGFNGLFAPTQGIGTPPTISPMGGQQRPMLNLPYGILGSQMDTSSLGVPAAPSIPDATAKPPGFMDRFGTALQSPATQIGLRLLANSGPSRMPVGFGQALGSSVLGYQQDASQQAQQKLQQDYLRAQIENARRKDTTPISVKDKEVLLDPVTRLPIYSNRQPDATKPESDVAKLTADFNAGLIDKPTYDSKLALLTSRQPPVNVTVNADKSFYSEMGSQRAKAISELYDQAQKAPQIVTQSQLIRNVLDQGAITGTGANFKLQVGKALRAAGINASADDVANTEILTSQLGQATLDAIKASGLGSGQGFTNTDRIFLENVVGGRINLDKNTLQRLSVLHEKAARETIKKWNNTYSGLDQKALSGIGMGKVEMPGDLTSDPTRPIMVRSPEEALRLEPGTIFQTPDGRIKSVPERQ